MLELAQIGRDYKIRPSELVQISNDADAFGFDRACSLRLRQFDNRQALETAKKIGIACALSLVGKELDIDDEDDQKNIPEAP